MKRVFLIHGWKGNPNNHWFPYLSLELKANGFEVFAPQMPLTRINADEGRGLTRIKSRSKLAEWLTFLKDYVGKPDSDTYFVGHSLGCIATARYLASLPAGQKIGGCVFVAGFSGRIDVPEISEFYTLSFEPEKARANCNKFVMIFSDNDRHVPMEKSLEMAGQLNAKTILERGKGHFCTSDGVTSLPSALRELLAMSSP